MCRRSSFILADVVYFYIFQHPLYLPRDQRVWLLKGACFLHCFWLYFNLLGTANLNTIKEQITTYNDTRTYSGTHVSRKTFIDSFRIDVFRDCPGNRSLSIFDIYFLARDNLCNGIRCIEYNYAFLNASWNRETKTTIKV